MEIINKKDIFDLQGKYTNSKYVKYDDLNMLIEEHMKNDLTITGNYKEKIIRDYIFDYVSTYQIMNDLNSNFKKLRLGFGIHTLENGNIVLCKYSNDRVRTMRNFNNFTILYDSKDYDFIIASEIVDIDELKKLYYSIVFYYLYDKIEFLQIHIIWKWIEKLDNEKNANTINDRHIINGNYYELVDMFYYLDNL